MAMLPADAGIGSNDVEALARAEHADQPPHKEKKNSLSEQTDMKVEPDISRKEELTGRFKFSRKGLHGI